MRTLLLQARNLLYMLRNRCRDAARRQAVEHIIGELNALYEVL